VMMRRRESPSAHQQQQRALVVAKVQLLSLQRRRQPVIRHTVVAVPPLFPKLLAGVALLEVIGCSPLCDGLLVLLADASCVSLVVVVVWWCGGLPLPGARSQATTPQRTVFSPRVQRRGRQGRVLRLLACGPRRSGAEAKVSEPQWRWWWWRW
jgi:hypothetical protein